MLSILFKNNRNSVRMNNGFRFTFNPDLCGKCNGKCCTSEKPSYLWVNEREIAALSEHLNLSVDEFKKHYLYQVDNEWTVKDLKAKGRYQCVFLDDETGKCEIYQVRPEQCKTYPYWNRFKKHPEELFRECIAVKNMERHK